MINDYVKTVVLTGLVLVGLFSLASPINNLPELVRMVFPDSYQQFSIAQLLLKQFWQLTATIVILGTVIYMLFVRD